MPNLTIIRNLNQKLMAFPWAIPHPSFVTFRVIVLKKQTNKTTDTGANLMITIIFFT